MKTNRRYYGAQIKQELLLDIKQRAVNDRLPPETELAEHFGVNRLTVNKVMAELSREGYVERIRGKGTFVIRPDKRVFTAQTTQKRLGQVVIAYPDYFAFDLWSKVNCAEELARRHEVELVNYKMNKGMAYESVAALVAEKEREVKGAIILSAIVDSKSLAMLDSLGIPIVILSACERLVGNNVTSVHRDYYKEGYLAVNHLIQAGHKRVGYIANEPWNAGSRLQLQGIKTALYENGFNLKDLARSPNGIPPWEDSALAGYRFTAEMLKKRKVTGLVYRSIPGAIGGMRAVAEAGLRIPDDISIIGEGEEPVLDYLVPPLTNIVCDYHAWMSVAFDAILNRSRRHEKQIVVDVKLVERKSVRNLNANTQDVAWT